MFTTLPVVFLVFVIPLGAAYLYFRWEKVHGKSAVSEKDAFTVALPKYIAVLGSTLSVTACISLVSYNLLVDFFSPLAQILFCIQHGLLIIIGIYLTIRTFKKRLIVNGDTILVYPLLSRSYQCEFKDIQWAQKHVYQVKIFQSICIQFQSGKRYTVWNVEWPYKAFRKMIMDKVDPLCLTGFGTF